MSDKKINLEDYKADGSDYEQSLSKILGVGVKDIFGYISTEFDEPTFKITRVILDDGSNLGCEGEHDFPYLVGGYGENAREFDDDLLQSIYDLENEEEAD